MPMQKNWVFWLIVLVIFTPLTFGMVIPLILFAVIIRTFFKNAGTTGTAPFSRPVNSHSSLRKKRIRLNARDQQLVDEKMTEYFNQNEKLPIIETVFLRPEKGVYTSLKELYITLENENIATLDEFGRNYPEMYDTIMKMVLQFAKEGQKERSDQHRDEDSYTSAEMTAEKYIEKINQLNIEISNEQITNGLYQTCALLKHIAMIEQKFPDNRPKLNKLYQYYLPILLDILENYKNLTSSAQHHEEFQKSEERLIKTIILINEAMKTISSTLCEEDFLNLSADMSTLEALLKKDGLVKEGTLEAMRAKAGDVNDKS